MIAGGPGLPHPESFRDPAGSLSLHAGRVLRRIHPDSSEQFARILTHPRIAEMMRAGRIVATWKVDDNDVPELLRGAPGEIYEHDPIGFPAYPAEWPAAMLADAALFTLDLASDLLDEGLQLKDATPANILHRGSRPVLVDVPSIVARDSGAFLWLARHQFETCFLLPLLAFVEAGIPIAWSLADPVNGLSHESLARILGGRRWRKPGLIASVALPAALGARGAAQHTAGRVAARVDEPKARFILARSFGRLRERIEGLAEACKERTSSWQGYTARRGHYGPEDIERKQAFVARALAECSPGWVLDVGANTGEFSELASQHASVVAADVDEASAGRIFTRAQERSLDILPIVMNIARPTPGSGWRNAETRPFLERARERFDVLMMLAVIHHLRVSAGVPLAEILALAAQLTTRHLIVEFVPATDPMFVQLARGREPLYTDWTRETFEALLGRQFAVRRSVELSNGRALYLAHKTT